MEKVTFRITGAYDAMAGEFVEEKEEDPDHGEYCIGRVTGKNIPGKAARTHEFYTHIKNNPDGHLASILKKIESAHFEATGITENIGEKLDEYNMKPPTGGRVERERLSFYMDRAFHVRRNEKTFSHTEENFSEPENDFEYHVTYNILSQNKISYVATDYKVLFEPDDEGVWMLKKSIYNDVILKVPKDSSPGYPYVANGFFKNEDLIVNDPDNNDSLYGAVNDYMIMLVTGEIENAIEQVSEMEHQNAATYLYRCGYVLPAMVFIKMEPTKKAKLARTIQGLCLVSGLVTKIILGDYLFGLPDRWADATHKVGMDFNTSEGKVKLAQHYAGMQETVEYLNYISKGDNFQIVTSDVQGYEWVARRKDAMNFWRALAECFQTLSPFHSLLIKRLGDIDMFSTVCIDSDGFVHSLIWYVLMSGKFVTHFQNSVTRAVQAIVHSGIEGDFEENMFLLCAELRNTLTELRTGGLIGASLAINLRAFNYLCMTNGDDCVNVQSKSTCKDGTITTIDFMKVTDVSVLKKSEIHFSSQLFVIKPQFWKFRSNPLMSQFIAGDFVKRFPDSFMKAVLRVPEMAESEEAAAGLMLHFAEHPGRVHLAKLIQEFKRWSGQSVSSVEEEAKELVKRVRFEEVSPLRQNFRNYTRMCYDEYVEECSNAEVVALSQISWLKESLGIKNLYYTEENRTRVLNTLMDRYVMTKYKAAEIEFYGDKVRDNSFPIIFDWVACQLA